MTALPIITVLAGVTVLAGGAACSPAEPSAAPDGPPNASTPANPPANPTASPAVGPTTPTTIPTTPPTGSPGRSDLEIELDCFLVDNATYSAGRGSSQREAVADLTRWYPPISRIEQWSDRAGLPEDTVSTQPGEATEATAGSGSQARADPSTWLLHTATGRGYGTATVGRSDPDAPEWVASVNQLCVAAEPPGPARYTDLTSQGSTSAESLNDPANAAFRAAMSGAIVGLPEGDAADALRAVGWRVRVGERDGVAQDNAGSSVSWINLTIADATVTGFTIG